MLDLVRSELNALEKVFTAERDYLHSLCSYGDNVHVTHVIALDTNAYLHRPKAFYEEDWIKYLRGYVTPPFEEVHLFIPMQVVRELDGHKRSQRNVMAGTLRSRFVTGRGRQSGESPNYLRRSPTPSSTLPPRVSTRTSPRLPASPSAGPCGH